MTLPKQQAGIKAGKARPPEDPTQQGGGIPATLPPALPSPPEAVAVPAAGGTGKKDVRAFVFLGGLACVCLYAHALRM